MLRKTLSVLLALSLWCSASRLVLAQTNSPAKPAASPTNPNPKQAEHAEKIKARIAKRGTGPGARIELRLRDLTKVKGYVSHVDEDYFVVVEEHITTRIAYGQVIQIKGEKLNKDREIATGLVIGLMILFVVGTARGGP